MYNVFWTLKAPLPTAVENSFKYFYYFREKSWHFIWILSQADDSHELSKLIFPEQ